MSVPKLRFKEFTGKWESITLEKLSKYRRGSFPQPYGLDKWYDDEQGDPFVQVYDVDTNMRLKPSTKKKISEEAKPFSVFVKKGSIILTIQGSIGRIAITQYDCYVDRTLLIFGDFFKPLDKWFFAYSILLLFEIEKEKAPGGTLKTITKEALSSFTVGIPTLLEQTKIADFLISVDEKIAQLTQKCELLARYKKGVMQQIFSQELRFKDDDGSDFPDWEEKKLKEIFTIKYGKDYKHLNSGNIPVIGTGGIMT
ncbi:MAG: restriction endonuclease subunit S [Pseudanabaena sp.]|nr:MAG: restriction endonuclease subunit S [Pseudanabaena sp.]